MDNKKLCIILPAFPSNDSDSFMVPFIQQFIVGFRQYYPNINLVIFTLYIPKKTPYYWNDILVIPLRISNFNLFSKSFSLLKAIKKVRKHIKKEKIDGILSFWYAESAIIGKTASLGFKIKHFTWLQGQDIKKSNFYIKYFKPKANTIIALSSFQNKIMQKEQGYSATYLNPISVNPFFFPELNQGNREIDILGAGSFIELKNYQLFLEIITELTRTIDSLKVTLIGNGPLEKDLKSFVRKNNIEKHIKFAGLLTHAQTLEYMNNAKIFLHTSSFEGGGMVLYESLYSGCQVVSTIPIEKSFQENFHFCGSKSEIINLIKQLLQNNTPSSNRSSTRDIKESTQYIYDLFFETH